MAEFKLGRIKFVYQGTWQPSTAYVVDDVVTVGGKTYICVISNTSSSSFVTDLNNVTPYWNLIADGSTWRGSWTNSTYYNLGDLAQYGGVVYQCTTAHTSASATATLTATAATANGSTATITFSALSSNIQPFVVGASITVAGFTSQTAFNGTFTVTACTATTVSYALAQTLTGTVMGTVSGTGVLGLEVNQSNWTAFASNLNWLGAWATNTRYKLDDFVYYGGVTYVCNTAHVSSNTAASGLENDQSKWTMFNSGLNYLGAWASATRYKLNDIVKYGADLWICTTPHTSSGTTINTSDFVIFVNGFEFENSWSAVTAYIVGDVVTYGGYTYTCIQNSTNNVPSTSNTYWSVFTTGLTYAGAWTSSTAYKIGNVVTLGGYTYVATADSTNQTPPNTSYWSQLNSGIRWNAAPNTTYTNVGATNLVSTNGGGSPKFDVTLSGTVYSVVVHSGSAGTGYALNDTLTILGTNVGGTVANNLVIKVTGVSTGAITSVSVVSGYAVTWKTGMVYVAGDAVYYGNSSFICISAHVGSSGVNDPVTDATGTYWNVLASGADSGVLTTQGDMVYYGANGPTRLPIGTDGQVLRVNGNVPSWSYYGLLNNIVYVAQSGVDVAGNGQGLTLDKPWASLLFACKQIEDGYLNTNAGLLLKINKQFMVKEVFNYIKTQFSVNVTGSGASGNTFTVGGSTTSAQTTTANLYYGMPIVFSAATGGIVPGQTYYVNTIPSATTFTVSAGYQTGIAVGITANSTTTSTASYSYTLGKGERDAGTLIDCVIFDLTHGGNLYVTNATQQFFATLTSYVTTNAKYGMNVWVSSLSYLQNTLMPAVLTNAAPSNNYQTLQGIPTASQAIQNTTEVATASVESGSSATAVSLLGIVINALSAGTYAGIPQLQRPHTSIYLKTGTYNEYGPIVLSQDTAILGDELRSTIVQAATAQPYLANDKTRTVASLQRIQNLLPAIVSNVPVTTTSGNTTTQSYLNNSAPSYSTATQSIINNNTLIQSILSGGLSAVPGAGTTTITYGSGSTVTVPNVGTYTLTTPTGFGSTLTNVAYAATGNLTGATTNYDKAIANISANIGFIQTEIAAYMVANYSSVWSGMTSTYQGQTLRDVAYLLNSMIYDMTYGGNSQCQINGLAYYSLGTSDITSTYQAATNSMLTRIQSIIPYIINGAQSGSGWTKTSGNNATQTSVTTGTYTAAGNYASALVGTVITVFGSGSNSNTNSQSEGSISGSTVTLPYYGWATQAQQNAFAAIQAQKTYIQTQIQTFVATQYPNIVSNLALTYRDAGTIIDALSYDMVLGSTYFSMISGRAFYRYVTSAQNLVGSAELSATEVSINYIAYYLTALTTNSAQLPSQTGDMGNISAVNLVVNNTAIIQNMFANGTVITGPSNSGYGASLGIVQEPAFSMPAVSNYNTYYLVGYGYGVTQIQNNYQFIKDEITNYLNNTLTGTTWSSYGATYQAETIRDLSNILDALTYDMTYGCNDQSLIAGRAFYSLNTALIVSPYTTGVLAALNRLSTIIPYIVQATSLSGASLVSAGNNSSQSTSGSAGSAAAAAFAQARIADIIYWLNNGVQNTTTGTTTGTISGTTLTVASGTGLAIGQAITGTTLTTTATATNSNGQVTLASVAGLAGGMPITFSTPYTYGNQFAFGGLTQTTYTINTVGSTYVTLYNYGTTTAPVLTTATGLMTATSGVAPGTYITGGSGTSWTVSVSQTLAATTTVTGTFTITPVVSGAAAFATPANQASFNAIQSRASEIQNDAQSWVQKFYQNESPSLILTNRDAGYIVTALSYDVLFNSNFYSIINGRAFNRLIPLIAALQANFADSTYGAIGFIGERVKLLAANGSVALTSAVIDEMVATIYGQPTNNAVFNGTINGTQLIVNSISSGVMSAGMLLNGIGINYGTALVSGATTTLSTVAITGTGGTFSCAALTTPLVVGQTVTITGTFSAGSITGYASGTAYYVIGTPTATTFTLSATQGGTAVTTTSSGGTITGITVVASPTTWLLNYSQSVSSTTTSIVNVIPTTNYITMGTTVGMVPGLSVTISGTSISNLSAGTYYIKQVLSATQLTLSQTYNGPVFPITANNTLSGVVITGTNGTFTCNAVSTTLAIGQPVTISGAFGGTGSITGYTTPTTYYIIATNGSTSFTLSATPGGSSIVTTAGTPTGLTYTVGATGSMTAVVYGIYNGLGTTTTITASGTSIPVTAVTTSTNLITVNSNAGMYINMPIVFSGLPNNITTTATTVASSVITLSATVSSLGVVAGQRVYFTGVMPQGSGSTGSIVFNQNYYVINPTGSTIQISNTLGGSAVTLTNATGLTMTAVFNAAGGLVNGDTYWINSVTQGTYPNAGTTITVTNSYKSGTAFAITNSLTGLTATASVGVATPQGINSRAVNGMIAPGFGITAYASASGYNNTMTTIVGSEILRLNKNFLANEATYWAQTNYGGSVTGTATNGTFTTSTPHNLLVGDPVQFGLTGTIFDANVTAGTVYWVLTTPSTTTFTVSTTQPGTGTQTTLALVGGSGTMSVNYYIITSKAVRDAGYHIDGLVYDLAKTGNYKSTRSVQLYLSAVNGSTTTDMFHVQNGTGIRNMTLNGMTGSLTLPNAYGTKRVTGGSYVSLDPGFGPNDSSVWAQVRSCYVQNVTNFGNGCVGLKIDAALHNGGNKSILGNDFTQVLSDGIGVYCTGHGALTECVSVFSYYGYTAYLAEYGGRIRATNGNSSYGTYGVIAEGADSFETPGYATLNNRYNQAYITNVVTDASNQVLRLEFENAGNAYTNGVPVISGAGYNIVAIQDEYRDSSVFETRLVDLNNGQGVGGSNYLTISNVAQVGAVGSITIANSDTNLSSAYPGMRVQITAGTGVGQYANIISYSSASKIASIVRPNYAPLTITTNTTSAFTVASTATMYVGQPIYLYTAIGGLTAATVYYVSSAGFTSTAFQLADTAAHATAGTNSYTLTATSATPATMAQSTIVGNTLTIGGTITNTIYIGMLLSGGSVAANTYITAGSGTSWTVSVTQNMASTTLTGTISVPVYEAGWDHVVPGTTIQPVLDATSTYIIEPAVSYTSPGFTSTSRTMSASATWAGVGYGQGAFVAVGGASSTATSYSTNGTSWTAGGALPSSTTWNNVVYGGGQNATATAVVGGIGGSGAMLTATLGTGATSGQVLTINVVNGGYNYVTPPTIVITDSTGTGATAVAQVLNGTITQVTMSITGSGYTNPTVTVVTSELTSITANTWGSNYFTSPTVTIAPPVTATAWTSSGTATSGNYYYYVDTSVSPNVRNYYLAGGSGTFSSTAPTFTNGVYGKSGYGATGIGSSATYGVTLTYVGTLAVATANLTNNGVSSFTITQTGYGYTTTPTITITDPNAGFLAISSASTATAYNLPTTLGSAWTSGNVLPTSTMVSLAYGNNLFIAVGGSGSAAAASTTGAPSSSWTNQSSNITANSSGYTAIAYGNNTFVAIGGAVSSYCNANPASWTAGGALTNKTWTGLAYGNGRFVALASDGTLQYSLTLGASWTTVSNNPLKANGVTTWSNIKYGEGLFVAIATSSQAVATSWDGLNWTYYASGMPSSSNWQGLAFGNPINTTLGAVPTWVAVSKTGGTIGASIATGATPLARAKVVSNAVSEIRMVEPGSGFPRGNVSATSTTSTGTITVDSTVNLVANQPIVFNGTSAGGITTGTYYFVYGNPSSTTFQISYTPGGSIVPLTAATISGMTYFASPICTITDPNHVNTASVTPRIGNGALGNPSFSNRGTGNTTATASYSGDGYADLYQTGTYINVSGLYSIPKAGSNVTFGSIPNSWYKLVQVTNVLGVPGNYTATFQINPGLTTLLAPPNGTLITTNLLYSNARLTGHDFLYIGTGGFTSTNYPNVDPTKAVQANQQLATGGGRVFFTSTDQDGNFNVGNLFGVQQSTGTATLNASAFNLSGLQSLTLGSVSLGVGSATITQFSTDPYFTANSDNVVPTQKAIKAFITAQIGGGQSTLNVNTITSGQIYIAGNTIQNTTGAQIYVASKMLFTGGIDGAPVALAFFGQK